MLGRLRKAIERSYIRGRAPNFSVRVILSRVYVQLDARLIKEGLWEDRFLREDRIFVEELRT